MTGQIMHETIVAKPPAPMSAVGPGVAESLLQQQIAAGRRSLVIIDPAVADRVPSTDDATLMLVGDDRDLDALVADGRDVEAVVGIGGGQAMDLAKLVVVELCRPGTLARVRRRLPIRGHVMVPDTAGRQLDLVLCPSTIGTGSQCSAGAVLTVGQAHKGLITSPLLVADRIGYDPGLLRGPRGLYDSGLLEVLARLLVPYTCRPSSLPYAEREAYALLVELGTLIEDRRAPDWLRAAMVSGESHAGWSLRGRGHTPSILWLLAMELSAATGITKNGATALLLHAWFDRVGAEPSWGDPGRLAAGLSAARGRRAVNDLCADVAETAEGVLDRSVDVDQVAATTMRRWGDRHTFGGLRADDLAALLTSALGVRIGAR